MSAPRTDIDKQKRRHLTPLVGVMLAAAFGFCMFLLWMFDVFATAEGPEDLGGETQEPSSPGSENPDNVEVDGVRETVGPQDDAEMNDDETSPDQ